MKKKKNPKTNTNPKADSQTKNSQTKNETLLHVGNFTVEKDEDYVRVVTADESWYIAFGLDTFKASWILALVADEKLHKPLEAWIVLVYHLSACSPDEEFLEGGFALLEGLRQRCEDIAKTKD